MPNRSCPDCDEPLFFAFWDTAGLGAWKQGDGYNTRPDTAHYLCFPCRKAWKQRLDGPFTPDVLGDLAFFSCREQDCGSPLEVTRGSANALEIELACQNGHRFRVAPGPDDGLVLEPAVPGT